MLVELAAEVGETAGLERFEGETMRFLGGVQGDGVIVTCLGDERSITLAADNAKCRRLRL